MPAATFPLWQRGQNNDALDRGLAFSVPQMDDLADFHGDLTDPKSKTRSGFAFNTTSRLAVSPRPVNRPSSGRSRVEASKNSRSFGRGALGQPTIFSGART